MKNLNKELNNLSMMNRILEIMDIIECRTTLACFNKLIVLFNLIKSEIKRGNKLQPFEKLYSFSDELRLSVLVTDLADRLKISKLQQLIHFWKF